MPLYIFTITIVAEKLSEVTTDTRFRLKNHHLITPKDSINKMKKPFVTIDPNYSEQIAPIL